MDTTGIPAYTIHKYLGWDKEKNEFSVNEYNGKKTPQVIVENWMYKPCDEKPKFRF